MLTHIVAPNPAAVWAGPHASRTQVQAIINQYHLNEPLYVQLYYYLVNTVTFNFGTSPYFRGQTVSSLVATFFPRTLELDFVAIILSIILGVFTGAFAAAHRDKLGDHLVRVFYLVTWCMPPFLVALVLQYFLAFHWVLPPSQLADLGESLPPQITGFISLDAIITGDWSFLYASTLHLILPVISLTLISFGIITRITRSSMLDILRTDYVRTAIMKGVGRRRAVYYHALKNSLIPVITIIALTFAFLIAGSVVIEQVFSYEGIGYLITTALGNYDYPTLIGATIAITIAVVLINFVADVLYAVVDPRIRFGGGP